MTHDTNNIDEAAYLALQGYDVKVTRTGAISALFSFEVDARFKEIRAKFWSGDTAVPLHGWLAVRTALKNECMGQVIVRKSAVAPSIVPSLANEEIDVRVGTAYWYCEGGDVKYAAFGARAPHTERLKKGNFYRSVEDAKHKRRPIQVD